MADALPTVLPRHAGGSATTRGLLFTVLGEFVLPAGRSAWTAQFLDVLARLGVEEKATRQALMRTAADGWLDAERVGRRTRWHLSGGALDVLVEGAGRIRGFRGAGPGWDGRWLVVLARTPESDRAARHLLRSRLPRAGFGSPASGVWVSTRVDRLEEARQVLADAGVLPDAVVLDGRVLAGTSPADLVASAWDLAALAARYRTFLAEFAARDAADPLARTVELVHAWRWFPWADPGLPADLLPADWPGGAAADLFARRRSDWAAAAAATWRDLAERAAD